MKKGERLHDFFYDAVHRTASHSTGQKLLTLAAPLLRQIFPREKSSRSAEEIFIELGYDANVFQSITSTPVRVFEHNLKGLLSFAAHHDSSLIPQSFSDEMPAFAIMSYRRTEDELNYVILSDTKDDVASYLHDISDMSGLPKRLIERLEGCPRLAKAMTLGHEMSHFEMGPTMTSDAPRYVEIESFCDTMPFVAFQKVSDPEIFDKTVREIILARAVFPIVDAVAVECKGIQLPYPEAIYGHATALLLDNPSILSHESPGRAVIEAYKGAHERIMAVLDTKTDMPQIFSIYCAAKDVLADKELPQDTARRAMELYVEAIEYFSPTYALKALKRHTPNISLSRHDIVQSADKPDLSLEI